MTVVDGAHETAVRAFYDEDGGEGAGLAYSLLMGDVWHHGDAAVERAGGTPREAAEAMQRRLIKHAGLRPGSTALDFGSGPGGATVEMAAMSGARFVGVSNTGTLTSRARKLAADRGLTDQVRFETIGDFDYRTLPSWPDGHFDAVFFLESVCHLPAKADFFTAAFRVLRPGGRLVGLDWLERPWGRYQTREQIQGVTGPVCEHIRLAGLGTLEEYAAAMTAAGFEVLHAADEFSGELCWGSTPVQERDSWLNYSGPSGTLFQAGKRALDRARGEGVFTVGWWVAARPA
ncbi:SAM-dependent methyltransferase [Actinoplanes sp. GCM10030250]|uniref:SAM-dependent methyltransferase n=1 Tax=Actinoplanes sp. GCM10030250 TaxID=3273376 RepID=UPI00360A8040